MSWRRADQSAVRLMFAGMTPKLYLQLDMQNRVADQARELASWTLENVPASEDRDKAFASLREFVLYANVSISGYGYRPREQFDQKWIESHQEREAEYARGVIKRPREDSDG